MTASCILGRSIAITVLLALAAPRADADERSGEPAPAWLTGLTAESAREREAALAELPRHMLVRSDLSMLLAAAATDPEVESRGRAAAIAVPALAPALAQVAREGAVETASRSGLESQTACNWLVALVATEIARRTPLDRLTARADRTKLFTAGTVTGAGWPLTQPLAFATAIGLLDRHGHFDMPVVLDPTLLQLPIATVEPLELLPSTAGGVLKRLLDPRDLRVVDLGVVSLVTDRATEESVAAEREIQASTREGLRIAVGSARLLVGRLIRGEASEGITRFVLWRTLAFDGAAEAAQDLALDPVRDGDLVLLAASARNATTERIVSALETAAASKIEGAVAALLEALAAHPRVPVDLGAALLHSSRADLRIGAIELCARGRLELATDSQIALLHDEDESVRCAWLVATLRGAFASPESYRAALEANALDSLTRSLADARFVRRCLAAWRYRERSIATPLGPDETAFRDALARRSPSLAAFALGRRAGSATPIELRASPSTERAAFVLGAALDSIESVPNHARWLGIAAGLAASDPDLAATAIARLSSDSDLLECASRIRSVDERAPRAVTSVIGIEHAKGRDFVARQLWALLRKLKEPTRLVATLYEEIQSTLSAVDRGDVDLIEAWEIR